jgi:hypothetical protein
LILVTLCIFCSHHGLSQAAGETRGTWSATIKEDEIHIRFFKNDDNNSHNNEIFSLKEFSSIPRGEKEDFKITREAGTILFNGKFTGNEGTGSYLFTPAKDYVAYMNSKGINDLSDNDLFAFFQVNIKRDYVQMLLNNGYSGFKKNDLIPLAALNVDEAYVRSWKQNGYSDIKLSDLIPLKSLGVTGEYLNGFNDIGYKNITVSNLIPMKSLGITLGI